MRKLLALLFWLLAAPVAAQVIPSGPVGSLNYWGVGGLSQVLNPGLAGQCLTTQGTGSAPVWVNCQVSSLSLLPPINTNQFYGNVSGQFGPPVGVDVNTILNTVGYDIARPPPVESIIYKSNVGPLFNWQALFPGTAGSLLTSGGPTNPPFWSPSQAQSSLAAICQTVGALLYFDTPSSLWKCLNPGTSGQLLQTGGAGANPSWLTVTLATLGGVPSTRNVNTSVPLGGGGPLSADLTLTCSTCATTANGGALSATAPVTLSPAGVIACPTCTTTSGTVNTAGADTTLTASSSTVNVEQMNPGGRLTLASGVPVMVTSQTAATSLFYAPYIGKYVPLFTAGTGMRLLPFTASDTDTVGLTLALGSSWVTNANYDAFAYVNGSSAGLCTGPDWSQGAVGGSNTVGSSSRGTGAGSTQLQMLKGLQTNQNSMTCRTGNASTITCAVNECTYLGSFRTGAAGQISFTYGAQGTAGTFNVWNAFNAVAVCSVSADATVSWSYTSATIRQANASTVNQFNFITGLSQGIVDASATGRVSLVAVNAFGQIGLALNSTTVFDKTAIVLSGNTASQGSMSVPNSYGGPLGANFISLNEQGDGTNANAFFAQKFMALRVCMSM